MSRYKLLSAGKNLFQTYRKPAVIIGCTCSCFYIGRRLMSTSNKKGPNEAPNVELMRVTRRGVEIKQNNARELYLNKSLDEKRKLYKCGNKYVLPSAVEDWATYAEKVVDKYDPKPKYDVNEGLNQIVCLWRGDITKLEIDGIVNAANRSLLGGGGVDGAIHAGAGSHLKEECSTLNGCPTGEAKITAGYNLPAKYVIHTVGPMGIQPDKLRNAYLNSLNVAVENGVKTIAFPCISTGIYGYDIEKATPVVLRTVREWLCDANNANKVDKIIFCVFLENDVEVYEHNLLQYFPVQNDKPPPDEKVSPKKAKSNVAGEQKKNKSENKALAKESSKSSLKVNSTEKVAEKEKEENKKGVTMADKENDTEEAADKGNQENIKAVVNVDKQTEKPFKEKCESTDKLSQSKNGKLTDESDKKDTKEKSGSEEVDDQNQSEKKAKKVKSAEDVLAPAAKRKPVSPFSKEHLRPPNAVL